VVVVALSLAVFVIASVVLLTGSTEHHGTPPVTTRRSREGAGTRVRGDETTASAWLQHLQRAPSSRPLRTTSERLG
jgi:hypothetical protein